MIIGLSGGLLLLWPAVGVAGAEGSFSPRAAHRTWSWDMTAGFDSYLHSYALATDDTTETLAEFMVQGGLEGKSPWGTRHRWRVRAEASAGTELYRERFAGDYRFLGDDNVDRVRLIGSFWGRQYRQATEYSRSSDNWEGRLEARAAPLVGSKAKLEFRAWSGLVNYQTTSSLEVDHHDVGGGAFVRSTGLGNTMWGIGTRLGQRTYPDSTAIDRDTWSVEADLDHLDDLGQGLRFYHKSERRLIRDETVRPSAWTHWSDFSGTIAAGTGHVFLDLQAEFWQYDEETDVYFNSGRIEGATGYRWGDLMTATWKLGLAGERLDAGDSPETYNQFGLRGGVESYGSVVGGSLTLEYGRRTYAAGEVDLDPDNVDPSGLDTIVLYTDFDYWKIWLMANWQISPQFDLDLMANYEPESHTENADDSALGFASMRVRWRP